MNTGWFGAGLLIGIFTGVFVDRMLLRKNKEVEPEEETWHKEKSPEDDNDIPENVVVVDETKENLSENPDIAEEVTYTEYFQEPFREFSDDEPEEQDDGDPEVNRAIAEREYLRDRPHDIIVLGPEPVDDANVDISFDQRDILYLIPDKIFVTDSYEEIKNPEYYIGTILKRKGWLYNREDFDIWIRNTALLKDFHVLKKNVTLEDLMNG